MEGKGCGVKVCAIAKSEYTNIDTHQGFGEDGNSRQRLLVEIENKGPKWEPGTLKVTPRIFFVLGLELFIEQPSRALPRVGANQVPVMAESAVCVTVAWL